MTVFPLFRHAPGTIIGRKQKEGRPENERVSVPACHTPAGCHAGGISALDHIRAGKIKPGHQSEVGSRKIIRNEGMSLPTGRKKKKLHETWHRQNFMVVKIL